MNGEEQLKELISKIEEGTNFETIKQMKVTLNKVFGEENNQIIKPTVECIIDECEKAGMKRTLEEVCTGYDGNTLKKWFCNNLPHLLSYQIIIYFDEIVITDGSRKHTIKELYIRVNVKPEGLLFPSIYGLRSYLTYKEAISNYAHSHLRACRPSDMKFSQFCTGEGPINQVMLLLSTKFTIPNFMLFCLHLKNFVAWESRDGRPYMYIENVGNPAIPQDPYPSLYEITKKKAALHLLKEMKSDNIDISYLYSLFVFSIRKDAITVMYRKEFELYAGEKIKHWNPRILFGTSSPVQSFLHGIDNTGRVFPLRKANTSIHYNKEKILLTFKENNIKLKIEESNETENQLERVIANREITNLFCKEFSNLLTNSAFTNDRIRSGNPRPNITEAANSSPVHV